MDEFLEKIDKQIKFNQGKNIFLDTLELFQFANETIQSRSNVNALNSESQQVLIDYATNKTIEEFCRINQYYSFNSTAKNKLRKIYSALIYSLQDKTILTDEISKNHYGKLKSWLKESNPFAEEIYINANKNITPVACSEYSSELQMKILHIDMKHLAQPVLDIGCGKEGNLVKYFLKLNIDARGIDRFSFLDNTLINSDWLEFNYGLEKWGTIISNLGFSNHFKHNDLREDGNYLDYAKKYMEILKSLKIGGRFHYAPDLPFIEIYLDKKQYKIDKYEIGEFDFNTTAITRLS